MKNFLRNNKFTTNYKSFRNFTTTKENSSNNTNQPNNNESNKSNQDIKLGSFYEFMEENIKNIELKNFNKTTETESAQTDEIKHLLEIIKCPITESNLEHCEEGLKVSHIIYPKRDGIFILLEEEAQFKF